MLITGWYSYRPSFFVSPQRHEDAKHHKEKRAINNLQQAKRDLPVNYCPLPIVLLYSLEFGFCLLPARMNRSDGDFLACLP